MYESRFKSLPTISSDAIGIESVDSISPSVIMGKFKSATIWEVLVWDCERPTALYSAIENKIPSVPISVNRLTT